MNHILVDANGRAVPLPFHTNAPNGLPVTVVNFNETEISCRHGARSFCQPPQMFGLVIVTEAEYMEKQSCAK